MKKERPIIFSSEMVKAILDDGDGFATQNKDGSFASPWRPSIHMPRWASRIILENRAITVVQDLAKTSDDSPQTLKTLGLTPESLVWLWDIEFIKIKENKNV